MPRIVPMISYEDVAAAADWLCAGFGFREALRYTASDGTVSHVELELDGGLVMLGNPDRTYVGPRRHAERCDIMRRVYETPYASDGFHVYVDDVEAHYEQARRAGARILSGLEETSFGDRHYRVEDPEGHRWMFAQHIRDVAPEDWGAQTSDA
jgi:uncharacterized glyoxalase superfamily protein PhnB